MTNKQVYTIAASVYYKYRKCQFTMALDAFISSAAFSDWSKAATDHDVKHIQYESFPSGEI